MLNRKALSAALAAVSVVVERRNTRPIFANVLFSATGDRLTMTATDSEVWVSVTVDAYEIGTWATTAPAADVLAAVKRAPGDVSLRPDLSPDGVPVWLRVASGHTSLRLPVLPADDFPQAPAPDPLASEIMADAATLSADCKAVAPFMFKDSRRYRPEIKCASFAASADTLRISATDGLKATTRVLPAVGPDVAARASLPPKAVHWLAKSAPREGIALLTLSESRASYECGAFRMVCKPVDKAFPDVGRLTVGDEVPGATVQSADLKRALALVMTVSDLPAAKTRAWLTLRPDGLRIACMTHEADGETFVDAESQDGAEITVSVCGGVVAAGLAVFRTDEPVRLAVNDKLVLIRSLENPEREVVAALWNRESVADAKAQDFRRKPALYSVGDEVPEEDRAPRLAVAA